MWRVRGQVLAGEALDWEAWLEAKRYSLVLNQEEKEALQAWATKIPKGAISTVTKVMGLLLKELLEPGA